MEICLNCMMEMPGKGLCPHCRKEQPRFQSPQDGLPLGFMLRGRYIIGKGLGTGGFGITYAAYDMAERRRVVVKECFPRGFVARKAGTLIPEPKERGSESDIKKLQDSFLREAQMLYGLGNCRGVAKIYHLFRENTTAYFVMEFLDGMDLRRWISSTGRLSWQQLSPYLWQLLDTLEFLHGKGIIHRDIAPDNLFLTSEGIKLIDFGAARTTLTGKKLTEIVKPGFAPAEQYTGGAQGAWTDIYALCATIYCCLTGEKPADSLQRAAGELLVVPSAIVPEILPSVEHVILKGMAVRPADRYQNIAELRNDLRKAAGTVTRSESVTQAVPTDNVSKAAAGGRTRAVIGLSGRLEGKRIDINTSVYVGKDAARCRIVFPASAVSVGGIHCTIAKGFFGWKIRDENSGFGTWKNRQKLVPLRFYRLKRGDEICLGGREIIRFE